MHEYSIVQALIERVTSEAAARDASAVRGVSVSIGELAGVEVDLLASAFAAFQARTVCEGALLDTRVVAARWICPECEQPIRRGQMLQCAACGVPARLAEGGDIILDRIELEVA